MIHEGERTIEDKIKQIYKYNEETKKLNRELKKRFYILFVCSECGFQISYQPVTKNNKNERLDCSYDDFSVWFKNDPEFKKFENKYKNTDNCDWGGAEKICLDCGRGLFNDEKINNTCAKCGSKNVISGNDICNKPCPICGTLFKEGINLQGYDSYTIKVNELENLWWNIYRNRYNVKKQIPPNYTAKEKEILERKKYLTNFYQNNDFFVIGNLNNAIRFEFYDAWMNGFICILEWFNKENGKLTLFQRFSWEIIEKNIKYIEIEQIIDILKKYDYFNKKFYKKIFGLDGYTFGIEVKIEDKYKELGIWGVKRGILYDIGMLLLKFGGKTFKDYYEYAW